MKPSQKPDECHTLMLRALKRIAAEANGGRNSANDDELRDWLWGIEDVARAAVAQATRAADEPVSKP